MRLVAAFARYYVRAGSSLNCTLSYCHPAPAELPLQLTSFPPKCFFVLGCMGLINRSVVVDMGYHLLTLRPN